MFNITLKLDPTLQMPPIVLAVLLIGFVVTIVNGLGQFFTLTPMQVSVVGFVAFVLTALSTLLTTAQN